MRMSGWWLAASASRPTSLTQASAAAKSASSRSHTIASPSRLQPSRSASRSSISWSVSRSAISSPSKMRIVSLVPHATELLFALGLGDSVVGVTHECDYPPATADLPKITRDVLPAGLSAAEIDAAVRERTEKGEAIYALDEDRLADLEPDLIVTQELCPVCAVSYDEGKEGAQRLHPRPDVIAPGPHTVGRTKGD